MCLFLNLVDFTLGFWLCCLFLVARDLHFAHTTKLVWNKTVTIVEKNNNRITLCVCVFFCMETVYQLSTEPGWWFSWLQSMPTIVLRSYALRRSEYLSIRLYFCGIQAKIKVFRVRRICVSAYICCCMTQKVWPWKIVRSSRSVSFCLHSVRIAISHWFTLFCVTSTLFFYRLAKLNT